MSDELTHNQARPISDVKIPAGKQGYHTEKWSGIDNFVCDGCGADTFNEALVKDHVERLHRERK